MSTETEKNLRWSMRQALILLRQGQTAKAQQVLQDGLDGKTREPSPLAGEEPAEVIELEFDPRRRQPTPQIPKVEVCGTELRIHDEGWTIDGELLEFLEVHVETMYGSEGEADIERFVEGQLIRGIKEGKVKRD